MSFDATLGDVIILRADCSQDPPGEKNWPANMMNVDENVYLTNKGKLFDGSSQQNAIFF